MTLALGYTLARGAVVDAGFASDLEWAASLQFVQPDERYVVSEAAWVILNSGFRYAVARKKWPLISDAFERWDLARIHRGCVDAALVHLNHRGKIGAMYAVANEVQRHGITRIVADAREPLKLTRLPFIGKITCWHLAKLLGADVVKPDVHLQRAAKAAGFDTALGLCEAIRAQTGDRLTVIDSVLWRYGEQMQKRGLRSWAELWA